MRKTSACIVILVALAIGALFERPKAQDLHLQFHAFVEEPRRRNEETLRSLEYRSRFEVRKRVPQQIREHGQPF